MTKQRDYLLTGAASELERLRLQARVWELEAETWLDLLGPKAGWRCLDFEYGTLGLLRPLARRVGPGGRVVGVDRDPLQLRGARDFVAAENLANVDILEVDAHDCGAALPDGAFDLVHTRFLFAPPGQNARLLDEMWRLTRPGGIIAIQEPDAAAWASYLPSGAWDRLKAAILEAFRRGGGDFDAGQRTFGMLRDRGAEDVRIRTALIALPPGHAYLRLPVQFATSLRDRILEEGFRGRRTRRSNRRVQAGRRRPRVGRDELRRDADLGSQAGVVRPDLEAVG
jgi:SAM-dependent methyltransferase